MNLIQRIRDYWYFRSGKDLTEVQMILNVVIAEGYYNPKDDSASKAMMCLAAQCAKNDNIIDNSEYKLLTRHISRFLAEMSKKYDKNGDSKCPFASLRSLFAATYNQRTGKTVLERPGWGDMALNIYENWEYRKQIFGAHIRIC